jgi:hypothetical protein
VRQRFGGEGVASRELVDDQPAADADLFAEAFG